MHLKEALVLASQMQLCTRNKAMRKLIVASIISTLFFAGGTNLASAEEACSNSTLRGSYIFFANGRNSTKPGNIPIAYAGMTYYDGNGHVMASAQFADKTALSGNGSYSVRKNCQVKVRYLDGRTLTYFLAPSGDEFTWVATSGPIWASSARRVSLENLITEKP